MSNAGLVPTCVCATPYQSTAKGYRFCPNCDRCQDVERAKDSSGQPLKRVPTQADRRFTLAWEKRKREIYGTP